MAYSTSIDERYIGLTSYTAGSLDVRDSFFDSSSIFGQSVQGTYTYGELSYYRDAFGLLKDVDIYDLGTLSIGTYSIDVDDFTWDFSNFDSGSVSSFSLLNSFGQALDTKYSTFSNIDFSVASPGQYYVMISGPVSLDAQYTFKYDRTDDLFINTPATFSSPTFSGNLVAGSKVTTSIAYSDADGNSDGIVLTAWFLDDDELTNGIEQLLTDYTSLDGSIVLDAAWAGKTLYFTKGFEDDLGNLETSWNGTSTTGLYRVGEISAANSEPSGTVSITGTAIQGQVLTADTSALSDPDGLGAFSYVWQANGVAIPGATSSTYTLTEVEVGKTITVTASYIDGFGTVESVQSSVTGAVGKFKELPSISFDTIIPIGDLIAGYDRDLIWQDANFEIGDEIHQGFFVNDFWAIGSIIDGVHYNLYLGIDGLEVVNGKVNAGKLTFLGITLDDGPLDESDDVELDLVKISDLNIELSKYFSTTDVPNIVIDTAAFNSDVFSGNNKASFSLLGDIAKGGDGNDTLDGGAGNDTLTGGDGSDTFVFRGVFDDDFITDFDTTEDSLDFYTEDGSVIAVSELVESTDTDGNRVLTTVDGSSSVTLGTTALAPIFDPASDIAVVQRGIVGKGVGTDSYILSPRLVESGAQITITDTGSNTLHLLEGLGIDSGKLAPNALLLTLNNGAKVTILDADDYEYILGGDPLTNQTGKTYNFATLASDVLGGSVPSSGISEVGSFTIGGAIFSDPASDLTSTMDTVVVQRGIIGKGAGEDTYVLAQDWLTSNPQVTITDTGENTIQFIDGLELASSMVASNAMKLTLAHGGTVTVLDASDYTYVVGGNPLLNGEGTPLSFKEFAAQILSVEFPVGSKISNGGSVTISESLLIDENRVDVVNGTVAQGTDGADTFVLTLSSGGNFAIENFDVTQDQLSFPDLRDANGFVLSDIVGDPGLGGETITAQYDPFTDSLFMNLGIDQNGDVASLSLAGLSNQDLSAVQLAFV